MGEYVKHYGDHVKLGTCEDLYYVTYPKYVAALEAGRLGQLDGNAYPRSYAQPDSGFRFRFPFPDEDRLAFGDIKGDFLRTVSIKIDDPALDDSIGKNGRTISEIEIVQQKLVHRESDGQLCLAIVCSNPKTGNRFRLEEEADVKKLLAQIVKFQINPATNPSQKKFYRDIALRILKGYRLETPAQTLERKNRNAPPPPMPDQSLKKLRR